MQDMEARISGRRQGLKKKKKKDTSVKRNFKSKNIQVQKSRTP